MFRASVARMLIASPGDVLEERDLARETAWRWSSVHGKKSGLVLLPTMWERDSTPSMSDRPQGVINSQLVDEADLLVGFFWTRLGTPTGEAASGTVEEIERVIAAGKPVRLYFSRRPVAPESLDPDEYQRLKDWKQSLRDRGLYHEYDTIAELRDKLYDDLSRTVENEMNVPVVADSAPGRAQLVARAEHEKTQEFDSKGKVRNKYRDELIVENRGAGPAEDLVVELVQTSDEPLPRMLNAAPYGRLVPGASASYLLVVAMAMARQFDVKLTWREGDQEFSDVQTVNL